jgi:hypothetical protein
MEQVASASEIADWHFTERGDEGCGVEGDGSAAIGVSPSVSVSESEERTSRCVWDDGSMEIGESEFGLVWYEGPWEPLFDEDLQGMYFEE